MTDSRNVLGAPLQDCCNDPVTGFFRDGTCRTGPRDRGNHTVCAKMTKAFLEFSAERGNDLMTPRPDWNFPGLEPGDWWCLCAGRWAEAAAADIPPPVRLAATEESALEVVDWQYLKAFAVDLPKEFQN